VAKPKTDLSLEEIVYILKEASLYLDFLDDFQRDLVIDRIAAYKRYSNRLSVTEAQGECLLEIAEKLFIDQPKPLYNIEGSKICLTLTTPLSKKSRS
jgi:hypothetical protein